MPRKHMPAHTNYYLSRPWLRYWLDALRADPTYGHLRFKLLHTSLLEYPVHVGPHNLPPDLYDLVDWLPFIQHESDRLPLIFIHQFGHHPIHLVPGFLIPGRLLAILQKSALSGCIFSVGIYRVPADPSPTNLLNTGGKLVHNLENLITFSNDAPQS